MTKHICQEFLSYSKLSSFAVNNASTMYSYFVQSVRKRQSVCQRHIKANNIMIRSSLIRQFKYTSLKRNLYTNTHRRVAANFFLRFVFFEMILLLKHFFLIHNVYRNYIDEMLRSHSEELRVPAIYYLGNWQFCDNKHKAYSISQIRFCLFLNYICSKCYYISFQTMYSALYEHAKNFNYILSQN